jgi:zinc D-Ala-D-Ala carboxypeptidase
MKKYMITAFLLFVLTSCSQLDSLPGKLPFLNLEKGQQNSGSPDEHLEKTPESDGEQAGKMVSDGPVLEEAYFNVIVEAGGKNIIQNPDNTLALVNKLFGLPADYVPDDLRQPNVKFPFGDQKLEKSLLRQEAAEALEEMFAGAKKEGLELYAISGFRSYERQDQLYIAEVSSVGEERAAEVVAVPGTSEHQTGLAMDISSKSASLNLNERFGQTEEGKWLAVNAHKYGFILRYPKGKEEITGYVYEPWHFRYVGKKAAGEMFKNQLTLEEYFDIVKKI